MIRVFILFMSLMNAMCFAQDETKTTLPTEGTETTVNSDDYFTEEKCKKLDIWMELHWRTTPMPRLSIDVKINRDNEISFFQKKPATQIFKFLNDPLQYENRILKEKVAYLFFHLAMSFALYEDDILNQIAATHSKGMTRSEKNEIGNTQKGKARPYIQTISALTKKFLLVYDLNPQPEQAFIIYAPKTNLYQTTEGSIQLKSRSTKPQKFSENDALLILEDNYGPFPLFLEPERPTSAHWLGGYEQITYKKNKKELQLQKGIVLSQVTPHLLGISRYYGLSKIASLSFRHEIFTINAHGNVARNIKNIFPDIWKKDTFVNTTSPHYVNIIISLLKGLQKAQKDHPELEADQEIEKIIFSLLLDENVQLPSKTPEVRSTKSKKKPRKQVSAAGASAGESSVAETEISTQAEEEQSHPTTSQEADKSIESEESSSLSESDTDHTEESDTEEDSCGKIDEAATTSNSASPVEALIPSPAAEVSAPAHAKKIKPKNRYTDRQKAVQTADDMGIGRMIKRLSNSLCKMVEEQEQTRGRKFNDEIYVECISKWLENISTADKIYTLSRRTKKTGGSHQVMDVLLNNQKVTSFPFHISHGKQKEKIHSSRAQDAQRLAETVAQAHLDAEH